MGLIYRSMTHSPISSLAMLMNVGLREFSHLHDSAMKFLIFSASSISSDVGISYA